MAIKITDLTRGMKVRIKRGALVHTSANTGSQVSKRAQTVTVHKFDPGWSRTLGIVAEDGTLDMCVEDGMGDLLVGGSRLPTPIPAELQDLLELVGAAATWQEVHDLVAESEILYTKQCPQGTSICMYVRLDYVVWAGAGHYYRWTDLKNVEMVG